MSTMTELRDYTEAALQDRASWLGSLCIYSVETTSVAWAELDRKMREGGLTTYIPPEPQDKNVFLRAATDGVRRTIPSPTPEEPKAEKRLLMREVTRDNGCFAKRIVTEYVSPSGVLFQDGIGDDDQKLRYREVVEIKFDKDHPERLYIRDLVSPRDDDAWELAQHVRATYEHQRGCVDGQAVRVMVRAVLESCHATALRPGGGCYFVNTMFEQRITALESVADVVPGLLVASLPIIDSAKQRQQVKRAFEYEAQSDLEALIGEMRDLVRGGENVSAKKTASLAKQIKQAKAKLAEYQTLLDDNLGVVDAKVSIVDQLQLQLLDKVAA